MHALMTTVAGRCFLALKPIAKILAKLPCASKKFALVNAYSPAACALLSASLLFAPTWVTMSEL